MSNKRLLLESASRFAFENRGNVVPTEDWNDLKKENPKMAADILSEVMLKLYNWSGLYYQVSYNVPFRFKYFYIEAIRTPSNIGGQSRKCVPLEITLCSQRCVYSQKVCTLRHASSQIITKTWNKTHQFCSENCKNLKFLSISLYF